MNKFTKIIIWFGAPALCGLLAALIILQLFPYLKGGSTHSLTSLTHLFKGSSFGPASYHKTVKLASPSVVHIFSVSSSTGTIDKPQLMSKKAQTSLGSGVIVGKAGYVLTNNHVIGEAHKLLVLLKDGRSSAASIVGTDPETDLAVLKINLTDLPVIQWADSGKDLRIGDIVLAMGNPLGLGQTVSAGIISATQRTLHMNTYESFIQTDAAINVGNSGGALVNSQGKLVGITTALVSSGGGHEGLGFAIPSNLARFVLQSIIRHNRVIRGWLGIEAQTLTPELAETYGLPVGTGILVSSIYDDSPAVSAGIKRGDIILKINGKGVNDGRSVMAYVASLMPGSTATVIQLLPSGQRKTIALEVAERPRLDTL